LRSQVYFHLMSVIHSRSLNQMGKRLSPAQLNKLNEALKRVHVEQEAARVREREAPRLNFIAAARRAGFTARQAEFLWRERYIPESRLIG
jgi:hypothetical protein